MVLGRREIHLIEGATDLSSRVDAKFTTKEAAGSVSRLAERLLQARCVAYHAGRVRRQVVEVLGE